MSKVKLVFAKSFVENPTWNDTFSQEVKIELPDGFENVHLTAARVYGPTNSVGEEFPAGPVDATILKYGDFGNLVGQLLTYVDATFADTEQRKAHKDIVKKIVYEFHNDMHMRAIQTVDSHTKQ